MKRTAQLSVLLLSGLAVVSAQVKAGERPQSSAEPKSAAAEAFTGEVKLTGAAIEANRIQLGKATMQVLTPSFMAPARVTFNAERVAHVGTILAGRAVSLQVRRGDRVKKDDELLVVESSELGQAQSDFLQRQTAVRIAGIAVEPAQNAYERAKKLYELSKGVALAEVQKREADYRTAQGALETAKAAVAAAENSLHLMGMSQQTIAKLVETGEVNPRFSIRAPISGQVIEREVTLGEHVSPEKEALLVLADTDTYWVLADVPEGRLADIAVGAKARITLPLPDTEPVLGTIAFIDASVASNTRSVSVRIEVSSRGIPIRPGMFAQAEISANAKAQTNKPVLAVPEEAIQTIDGSSVVFVPVPGKTNTFTKCPVVIGPTVNGMVPVVSGLKDNADVVVAGSFVFKAELGKSAGGDD